MIILGLDPGTATTGYGVINSERGKLEALGFGVISTSKDLTDAERLLELSKDLKSLIHKFSPKLVGVEKLFFTTNQKTVMQVSQSRGVILLTLEELGLPISELTPLQVKSSIAGYGKADKKQIQFMVKKTLGLSSTPKPDDAADALAIAICAGQYYKTKK